MEAIDLRYRLVTPPISFVVQVDREHSRVRADERLPLIRLVNLEHLGGGDVFPTMIFEVPHVGFLLPFRCHARPMRGLRSRPLISIQFLEAPSLLDGFFGFFDQVRGCFVNRLDDLGRFFPIDRKHGEEEFLGIGDEAWVFHRLVERVP
jgi:hypothetical protein